MTSIHQRIKKLRESKKLSQEALASLVGVKYQSVQEWERENGTAPSRKRQAKVAAALGVSVQELMTGAIATTGKRSVREGQAPLLPREEMILILFRGLTPEQQREMVIETIAMVDANRRIREFVKGDLHTFSNEEVHAAFGDIPTPKPRGKSKDKAKPRRDIGDAMGDFLGEE